MIRRILLVAAGIFVATLFACAPPSSSPPAGTVHGGPGVRIVTCDPTPFVSKVYTLSSSYVPVAGNYSAPLGVMPVGDPFKTDLGAAYCMAPTAFQRQLLELTGVFITCSNPNACAPSGQSVTSSWGFRENANNESTLQHTYIGLSADIWPSNTLMAYGAFEYAIFDQLLQNPGLPVTITPQDSNNQPSPATMTVLAALAHELGHILWWKLDVLDNDCGGTGSNFSGYSWQNADAAPQFHKFGDENPYNSGTGKGNSPKNNRPDKNKVIKDIQNNNGQVYKDLNNIYSYWASLFATVSPDEDFVETYKLWTLMSAQVSPLASMVVTIPNYPPPADPVKLSKTSGTDLNKKVQWISSCFAWPSGS